jgi:thiamine biosynthesis protein ThiS
MHLEINGHPTQIPDSCHDVERLLAHLRLGYPVLVELNGLALFPREFASSRLQDGDKLELMRMVAGG